MDADHILEAVERYLRESGMRPTTFGERAMNDPRFVFDLRKGKREIFPRTAARVMAYIDHGRAAEKAPKRGKAA